MTSPGPTEPAAWRGSRASRRLLVISLAIVVALGLILLFLLTQATDNQAMYERYYRSLFALNVVVAVLLIMTISWMAWRLLWRLRQGRFGSRLLVKLAAVFALAGFAPGVLIYVVSYQFVSRSIESWFDVQVEGALEAGLGLGRATLDTLSSELGGKTRTAALQLQDTPDATAGLALERMRDQFGAADLLLWGNSGQLLASAGTTRFQLGLERPATHQFRNARNQRTVTWIEGLDDLAPDNARPVRLKALVQVQPAGLEVFGETRFLQVSQDLPTPLLANVLAVVQAHREYQERALARDGLRRMYIGTLTLSLFLAVFGAVLLAVVLGNQITRPLLLLAEGMRQVAGGDLRPKAVLQGRDELGGLTRTFADMTQQLADARQTVERSVDQVNAARARLQTILDNLTAGVIVLDTQGIIQSVNPGATRILRVPLAAFVGRRLEEIVGLEAFGQQVQTQFQAFLDERSEHGIDHWQHSFELTSVAAARTPGNPLSQDMLTLVARGAELPDRGRLLVLDDISEIVSAQRAQAWGEVARRLAHEIKNPLTPIQLSAERMEMKLVDKLAAPEQAMLIKSVKTIVDQVDAMKRLVNEFRDYARLPAAQLSPLDLNALVTEVLQLYEVPHQGVSVRMELDERCPPIYGDAQQLRQVLHNLLQNAQDATLSALDAQPDSKSALSGDSDVLVRTQWSDSSRRVRLVVQDRGAGFPEGILKRAFEPYVTTKAKGTGLGLAVVKKIADEHGARIDLGNRMVDGLIRGAQVSLSFAVDRVAPV